MTEDPLNAPVKPDAAGPAPCPCPCRTPADSRADPTAMELEAYKSLVSLLNAEETAFWSRNNLLFAVHGALLAATAGILGNTDKVLAPGANVHSATLLFQSLIVLSLFGLGMAIAWLFMVARGKRIADTITGELKNIEDVLSRRPGVKLGEDFQVFRLFGAELGPIDPRTSLEPIRASRRKLWWIERVLSGLRLADVWLWVGAALVVLWAVVGAGLWRFSTAGHATPLPAVQATAAKEAEALAQAVAAAQAAARSAADAASSAARAALAADRAASAAAARPRAGSRQARR